MKKKKKESLVGHPFWCHLIHSELNNNLLIAVIVGGRVQSWGKNIQDNYSNEEIQNTDNGYTLLSYKDYLYGRQTDIWTPKCGAPSYDLETMTWATTKRWMPNWLYHPDTPK